MILFISNMTQFYELDFGSKHQNNNLETYPHGCFFFLNSQSFSKRSSNNLLLSSDVPKIQCSK